MSPTPQPPTRLTVSGGRNVEPRLMMAHPIGETKTQRRLRRFRYWLSIDGALAIAAIVATFLLVAFGPHS